MRTQVYPQCETEKKKAEQIKLPEFARGIMVSSSVVCEKFGPQWRVSKVQSVRVKEMFSVYRSDCVGGLRDCV